MASAVLLLIEGKMVLAILILVVLLAISVLFNVVQFCANYEADKEIEKLKVMLDKRAESMKLIAQLTKIEEKHRWSPASL